MKTASEIKDLLLNGEEVSLNGWVSRINASDEVEIIDPSGEGYACRLAHLERAVGDFMKMAGGIPEKMPKPISYPATKSPASILGPDSTSNSPWSDPKVNQTSVPKGKKSDPKLMGDTSTDSPWSDPRVNTRPEEPHGKGGLPNTELGKDTTRNKTKWAEKSYIPSETNKDHYDPTVNEAPGLNTGEEPSSPEEFFKGAAIVDSFEGRENRGPSYRELVAASPSANLLRDISDPYKWNMNRVLDKLASPSSEEKAVKDLKKNPDVDNPWAVAWAQKNDAVKDPSEKKRESASKQAGPMVNPSMKESWGANGEYSRHLEVESAQDLHKLVMALGGEGVEWESADPANKQPMTADPTGQAPVATPLAQDTQQMAAAKRGQAVRKEPGYDPTMDPFADEPTQDEHQQGEMYEDPTMQLVDQDLEELGPEDFAPTSYPAQKEDPSNDPWSDLSKDQSKKFNVDGEQFSYDEAKNYLQDSMGIDFTKMSPEDTNSFMKEVLQVAAKRLIAKVKATGEIVIRGIDDMKFASYSDAVHFIINECDHGMIITAGLKTSVDEAAKSYWKDYLHSYGEDMAKNDRGNKSRKDEGKSDKFEPKVDETPEPENKGSKVEEFKSKASSKRAQSMPPGGQISPSDTKAPAAPGTPGPAIPNAGPAAPAQPKPDAGNEGLKALGWLDTDINLMGPEDKQKILQVQLKKPGTSNPSATPTPNQPAPTPPGPKPVAPAAPAPKTPMPGAMPGSPAPVPAGPIAASFREVMNILAQTVPIPTQAPAAPTAPAAVPGAEKKKDDLTAPPTDPALATPQSGDFTPQENFEADEARVISNALIETIGTDVQASTTTELVTKKIELLKRKIFEALGKAIPDAEILERLGISRGKNLDSLFKSSSLKA